MLRALERVPRREFAPDSYTNAAHEDRPLPIGGDQTNSQPYVVAFMTEAIKPQPDQRVVEIGGSGHQAAILGELVRDVYTIELIPTLAERGRSTLERLGYRNVHVGSGAVLTPTMIDGVRSRPHRPFPPQVGTKSCPVGDACV